MYWFEKPANKHTAKMRFCAKLLPIRRQDSNKILQKAPAQPLAKMCAGVPLPYANHLFGEKPFTRQRTRTLSSEPVKREWLINLNRRTGAAGGQPEDQKQEKKDNCDGGYQSNDLVGKEPLQPKNRPRVPNTPVRHMHMMNQRFHSCYRAHSMPP
jgi:hypothetical protein